MFKIIKIFIFWRIGLFMVTYLGSLALPKIANSGIGAVGLGKNFNFWASWAQWDGGNFYNIAKFGYLKSTDYAFFPFYPQMTRVASFMFFKNILVSGLLISNIAMLIFLMVFFNFVEKRYSRKIATNSVLSFLVFPTTFFTVAFYSESVFLLLVVLTFVFLANKKFFMAAVFTSLASLSRLVGVLLFFSVSYSYFASLNFAFKKISRRGFFYIIVSILGFVIYAIYLEFKVSDPLKFLNSQAYWQRTITDPATTIFSYLWGLLNGHFQNFNDYLDLSLTLIFLVMLIGGIRKIPSSLWIFSVLVILIPASTGTLTSMPRYLLASLGTFIIIAKFLEKKPSFRLPLWTISLLVQAILSVLFVSGYWVA